MTDDQAVQAPLEFPGALLRRAGATRTDVLAIEARWSGSSADDRQDFLDHLGSLDEAGLRAELRDILDGYDAELTSSEVPVEDDAEVEEPMTPVAPPLPVPDDPLSHDPELAAAAGIDQSSEGFEEVPAVEQGSVLNGGDNTDNVVAPAQGQPATSYDAMEEALTKVLEGSRDDLADYLGQHPGEAGSLAELERKGRARRSWLRIIDPVAAKAPSAG